MNIEKQVCSLELAQKLKELCVPQESYFAWYDENENMELACQNNNGIFRFKDGAIIPPSHGQRNYCAAFTVAELGEMLPSMILGDDEDDQDHILFLEISKDANEDYWDVEYSYFEGAQFIEHDYNLANAMAKMLIYLIENNLLNVKDI